ncbi:Calcium-binding mitochondrial carrier protein SCaMC-3, partial [Varanus komodoensis]
DPSTGCGEEETAVGGDANQRIFKCPGAGGWLRFCEASRSEGGQREERSDGAWPGLRGKREAQPPGGHRQEPAAAFAAGGLAASSTGAMLGPQEGAVPRRRRQQQQSQVSAAQESPRDPDRQQRWASLFEQLDTNKDGRVDINELREGLARMGMDAGSHAEQDILRDGDTDQDGELNFEEFARYLQERERKLLLMFHSLDRNHD